MCHARMCSRINLLNLVVTWPLEMFTKPRRQTSIFSNARDRARYGRRQALPAPWLIAAFPVALLAVELLLRVGVGIAGKGAEFNAYQGEPPIATAYRFKPFTSEQKPVQGVPGYGGLAVQANPLTGYQLMPKQENAALQINAQGLRSAEDIPIAKPTGEVRILVIGGSTAFGSLASNNQTTFAHQLETRLNQQVKEQKSNTTKYRPDVLPFFADEMEKVLKLPPKIADARYRVINAAVPGYLSSNTLADYTTRLQAYQPNVVVLMDGYADLLSGANAAQLPTDQLAAHPVAHLGGSLREGFQGLFNHLYITKALRYWVLKPEPKLEQLVNPLSPDGKNLTDQLSADANGLTPRIDRYQQNLKQLAILTQSTKTPFVVALSPELHQREAAKQTPAEKQRLAALGNTYQERVKTGYGALDRAVQSVKAKHSNLIIVPLTKTLNQVEGDVFQDTVHLTDKAQSAVSDRLYQTIAPMLQVKPKPFAP
jgi:lysophospholipase L1-like esterase